MDPELKEKLETLEQKVEETRVMARKTYKLFFWTMVATVVMFVLPLIALVIIIPFFLKSITSGLNGL
jgi:ABC-type arginine transport system permease subunit